MIDRKERSWLIGFILVVIVLTTFPYVVGYLRQTPDWHFSGLFFSLTDSNSYLAKMLRGASGDWLFRTPYTTLPQRGVLAFLPYLLLGKLSAAPGQYDQLIVLFQLFRISGIVLLCWVIYRFISRFIDSISLRRFGLFLAVFGGGLGWLTLVGLNSLWQGRLPLEFYSPESLGFLSYLGIPHLLFARALLLLGLEGFLFSKPGHRNFKQAIKFLAPWLLIGFFQPISLITACAILGVFIFSLIIFRNRIFRENPGELHRYLVNSIWFAAVALPVLIYNFVAFRIDPVLASWLSQNILPSPPILDYLLAFGLILPFAIFGLIVLWRKNRETFLFFTVGICLFPILAYFPIPIQRRLPEGIWLLLLVPSLVGITSMGRRMRVFSSAVLTIGVLTSLMILLGSVQSVLTPMQPRFVPSAEVQALEFLQSPEFKDKHILASFDQSNRLGAWAPVFLLTGLGPESTDLKLITPQIERYFGNHMSSGEELKFLKMYDIDFVFFGPEEQKFGNWDGGTRSLLTRIFNNSEYAIFEVSEK